MNASASDLAGLDERARDRAAVAVHDVDDARREGLGERAQERRLAERAVARQLRDDRVAHDQRRDQRRERLVERVVERPHAQHDPERRAADLGEDARARRETPGGAVDLLQRLDRVEDVLDRAVELLLGVAACLADLPHQQPHRLLADLLHARRERLHGLDPGANAHRRPAAAPVVPRGDGGVKGGEGLLRRERGVRTHAPPLDPPGRFDTDGRGHLAGLAGPAAQLAADEVQRAVRVYPATRGEIGRLRHVLDPGEERFDARPNVLHRHGLLPRVAAVRKACSIPNSSR